jgi:hypothetical protein
MATTTRVFSGRPSISRLLRIRRLALLSGMPRGAKWGAASRHLIPDVPEWFPLYYRCERGSCNVGAIADAPRCAPPSRHFLPGSLQGLPDGGRDKPAAILQPPVPIEYFRSAGWPVACRTDPEQLFVPERPELSRNPR